MALPRGLGLRPDRRDERDFLFRNLTAVQHRLALTPMPTRVDLRSNCSPVRDQLDEGSCTSFAWVTGLIEHALIVAGRMITCSDLWFYQQELKREHRWGKDVGASLRAGAKVAYGMGVPPESEWPYNPANLAVHPPFALFADAAKNRLTAYHRVLGLFEMKQVLAIGQPVVYGVELYASFNSAAGRGEVPLPDPDSEQSEGEHALCAVGYDDAAQVVITKNSWGTSFGDKGYVYLPYSYWDPARRLALDLWTGTL